jgi:predicted alpha/beta-fold hydrolase
MYHSGETTDLRLTLGMLAGRFPDQRLLLAGVSLGGNVLLKYLGEDPRGVPSQLVAAAAMSVPFDLEAGSRYLQKGFSRVYDRHFVQKLRAKAIRKLEQYPGLFDRKRLNAAKTIEDFDHVVTAPVHGFLGSHDYYTRSSSIHYISSIQLPTLLLSAKDDPFLPASVLQRVAELARENSALAIEFTDRGGHVGFLGGAVPFRPIYWGERRLLNFLEEQLRYLPA